MNITQHIEADTESQAALFSALVDPARPISKERITREDAYAS